MVLLNFLRFGDMISLKKETIFSNLISHIQSDLALFGRFGEKKPEKCENEKCEVMFSTVSTKSTVCAYCFCDQNPARACLLDTVRLLFIIKSCVFIKFWLFSQFFWTFPPMLPNFSPF